MNRRALVSSVSALLFAAAAAMAVSHLAGKRPPKAKASGPARLVSLSPALTETVLALDSGQQLVGVSDYCQLPSGMQLPRVGSALTPSFEAIAALRPTLILCDGSVGSKVRALAELAPCEILPWLTLREVVTSTRQLGRALGKQADADALAAKLDARLSRPPPAGAPRVLLLLSYDARRPRELWFIKRNSLHGAALSAAGARNAVDRDVPGLPKLNVEELVALSPDLVLILLPPGAGPDQNGELVRAFGEAVPLEAAKQGRVAALDGTLSVGPSILQLVDALELALVSGARRE